VTCYLRARLPCCAVLVSALTNHPASAEDWPTHCATLIVPWAAAAYRCDGTSHGARHGRDSGAAGRCRKTNPARGMVGSGTSPRRPGRLHFDFGSRSDAINMTLTRSVYNFQKTFPSFWSRTSRRFWSRAGSAGDGWKDYFPTYGKTRAPLIGLCRGRFYRGVDCEIFNRLIGDGIQEIPYPRQRPAMQDLIGVSSAYSCTISGNRGSATARTV